MKKPLLCALAAGLVLIGAAETKTLVYSESITVGGLPITRETTFEADLDAGTAKILSINPKPSGAYVMPSEYAVTNSSTAYLLAVTEIGDGVFANARALMSLTFPDTLMTIGDYACSNCTALSSVTLGKNLRSVGCRPFVNTAIRELELPDSLLEMDGNIAAGTLYNASIVISDSSHFVYSDDGVLYNRDMTRLYACPPRTEGSVTIPASVTAICRDAFFGCFRLTYLNLPESVTTIGDGAFNVSGIWPGLPAPEAEAKLTSVFYNGSEPAAADGIYTGAPSDLVSYIPSSWGIPAGMSWKGRRTQATDGTDKPVLSMTDADNITWFYRVVDGHAELYNNGQAAISPKHTPGVLYVAENDDEYFSGRGLKIPSSINGYTLRAIGDNAFDGCSGLTVVGIPGTVESIGKSAFANCSALKSIDSDASVPFAVTDGLINLPFGIMTIGEHAFYGTKVLTISIPTSVKEIDGNPFAGCEFLTTVTVDAANPKFTVVDNVLYDKKKSTAIGVPANTSATSVSLPSTVKTIGPEAFLGCESLDGIILSDFVSSVAVRAFVGCSGLDSITFPAALTDIGSAVFSNCTRLASVNYLGNAPSAPDDLYAGTPTDLTSHANATATGWSGNEWKERPLEIESAGSSVYALSETDASGCKWTYTVDGMNLTLGAYGETPVIPNTTAGEITVPSTLGNRTVTDIPEDAFAACGLLTKITIPKSVTNIAASAFNGCTSLVEIAVATDNPAFCARYRCLYSKDGKTLVRVPAATRFAATQTQTTTGQKKDIVEILGTIKESTGLLQPNTIITKKTYGKSTDTLVYAFTPALSAEKILAGVTRIADCAFSDCGRISEGTMVSGTLTTKKNGSLVATQNGTFALPFATDADKSTESTNILSTAAGFYQGKVCLYRTATFGMTTFVTDVPLVIPASVTSVSATAFDNAHFTSVSHTQPTLAGSPALMRLGGTSDVYGPLTPGISASLDMADFAECTASGLPAGLKWTKASGILAGIPSKPGTYTVTFKRTVRENGRNKTLTQTATVRVADYPVMTLSATRANALVGGNEPLAGGQKLSFYVGVNQQFALSVTDDLAGAQNTITAKGLPSGLKLVKTALKDEKKVVTNYVYTISGTPTKAQTSKTVTLTVSNKYKWSGSLALEIEILALPTWASGSYNGVRYDTSSNAYGAASATLSTAGKLSGKFLVPSDDLKSGKTYTFSAASLTAYDAEADTFLGTATMKIGKTTCELPFSLAQAEDGTGLLELEAPDGRAELVQNIWNRKDLSAPAYAKGTKVTVDGITFKYAAKGVVTWSGKIEDDNGKALSVSGTSQLLNDKILVLYVAPKKNLLGGICQLIVLP